MRPAVFLDRDGTLNTRPAEHCYVRSVDEFAWIDGAAEAIALLAHAGYTLAVVSNQRGIARGILDANVLGEIEALIQRELRKRGCRIDAFRYCPHDANAGCTCRKPAPGMLLDLANDLQIDLSRSWMIGDAATDVIAGRTAGCRTVLVGNQADFCHPDLVAPTLAEGARLLLDVTPQAL